MALHPCKENSVFSNGEMNINMVLLHIIFIFTLPVKIYFAGCKGTAEEMILDLMGKKMLSNQLLSG